MTLYALPSGPDLEAPEFAFTVADFHLRNHGARRSAPRPLDDRLDSAGLAVDDRFDAAVAAVAHPAEDAQLARLALHVEAEAHALHSSGDGEMFGNGHCCNLGPDCTYDGEAHEKIPDDDGCAARARRLRR